MQTLPQILTALAAASLFVFATTRNLVVSGIAGVLSLVFYDLAVVFMHGDVSTYVCHLPLYLMFYASYLVLSVSFTRYSPKIEEKPRLPGIAIGMFSILVLVAMFYVIFYLAPLPVYLRGQYAYIVAFLSAVLLVVFLARDIAKIGLALLCSVWFAHAAIPEANAMYTAALCVVSMFVIGATVYYAYREYNSRNVDLMIKLRL